MSLVIVKLAAALSTLGSNEFPLDPKKGPRCLVCHHQDLADGIRSNYADKAKDNKYNKQKTPIPHFYQLISSDSLKRNIEKFLPPLLLQFFLSLYFLTIFTKVSYGECPSFKGQ